jgi:hypothetical protein
MEADTVNRHITKKESKIIKKLHEHNLATVASTLLGLSEDKVKRHIRHRKYRILPKKRPHSFIKKRDNQRAATIIETWVSNPNLSFKEIANMLNTVNVADSIQLYFPYKGDNKEVITLQSRV